MTHNPQISKEGWLLVDHRASPGLPESVSDRTGLPLGEGKVAEAATLTCAHCRNVFVKNPNRTRERGYCSQCDSYICDWCVEAMREPDYVHLPFDKLIDLVKDGKVRIVGGTAIKPVLLWLK